MGTPVAFSVTELDLDDVVAVVVSGDIDMATAPELRRVLLESVEVGRADLVVDMSTCAFIDCVGWGVLVGVAETARILGGGVTLGRPSPWMCRVRHLLGLETVLPSDEVPIRVPAP